MVVLKQTPESQFAYVVVAARRARQLMAGAPPIVDHPRSHKPTRVAMEELDQGVLEYQPPELPETAEEKEAKRRKS
ncbi:MAG TPA: DNA-directed RNA polymerase subunit omega [Candidatus Dormibacteraeota bacterium]|jgi:DNA-directed RNA polymerase subunit omega|nr:DNA-directed RNA polymerase subunit omega [Candidatus Dormibacteraeota bacterium]